MAKRTTAAKRAAKSDKWWLGLSDAEIAKRLERDNDDFFRGRGNWVYGGAGGTIDGECMRSQDQTRMDSTDDCGYYAPGADTVLDALTETDATDAQHATRKVAVAALLSAIEAFDAQDKRRKLADTARAVLSVKWAAGADKPNMSDLARVLNVSRPTAIGRFRKLVEVAPTLAWDVATGAKVNDAKREAAHEAALRDEAARNGIDDPRPDGDDDPTPPAPRGGLVVDAEAAIVDRVLRDAEIALRDAEIEAHGHNDLMEAIRHMCLNDQVADVVDAFGEAAAVAYVEMVCGEIKATTGSQRKADEIGAEIAADMGL
jgi:hypothetical protein